MSDWQEWRKSRYVCVGCLPLPSGSPGSPDRLTLLFQPQIWSLASDNGLLLYSLIVTGEGSILGSRRLSFYSWHQASCLASLGVSYGERFLAISSLNGQDNTTSPSCFSETQLRRLSYRYCKVPKPITLWRLKLSPGHAFSWCWAFYHITVLCEI